MLGVRRAPMFINPNTHFKGINKKEWTKTIPVQLYYYLWGCGGEASWAPVHPECCPAQPGHSWSCTAGCLLWSAGFPKAPDSPTRGLQAHNPVPPQSPEEVNKQGVMSLSPCNNCPKDHISPNLLLVYCTLSAGTSQTPLPAGRRGQGFHEGV